MALITQTELENRLDRQLSTEEASNFVLINNAMQAYIEKVIGSDVESVSATTKYYDGDRQHIDINPCTDVTVVKFVDEYVSDVYTYLTNEYTVEPVNRTLKTMIRKRRGEFADGFNNIAVTAKFSIYEDTKILNIVKDALLNALVAEMDNSDDIKRESIEGYSVEFASSEAKSSLDSINYLFAGII